MGWIIDEDHLAEGNLLGPGFNRAGKSFDFREDKPSTKFKLFDDDGELYYSGRINDSWLNGDESKAFAPLDFGMADAGCTRMDYHENGQWETL